jgi:hypothetical protein
VVGIESFASYGLDKKAFDSCFLTRFLRAKIKDRFVINADRRKDLYAGSALGMNKKIIENQGRPSRKGKTLPLMTLIGR